MLLEIKSLVSYIDTEEFLSVAAEGSELDARRRSFDKLFPIDETIDVVIDGEEASWLWRLERYVDEFGDTTVIAKILKDLKGSYLMDIRSNSKESSYIVTQIKS